VRIFSVPWSAPSTWPTSTSVVITAASLISDQSRDAPARNPSFITIVLIATAGLAANAIHTWKQRAQTLEREQELVNNGDSQKADLTSANYEFGEASRDSAGRQVVQIKPKRSDVLLVDGHAVLDEGGELVRVEGKLSKNPSFWTSLVNIVRRYARIGGVRVPVATETTAKVKFVGAAQMQVVYDYESVNGRAVSLSERRSTSPLHSAEQSGW